MSGTKKVEIEEGYFKDSKLVTGRRMVKTGEIKVEYVCLQEEAIASEWDSHYESFFETPVKEKQEEYNKQAQLICSQSALIIQIRTKILEQSIKLNL